jgi:hypothetical protein
MYFEVSRARGVWLLQKRSTGWQAVRLRAVEPTFQTLTPEERARWQEATDSIQLADPVWELYLKAWRRLHGR